ncbi:MAG: hypothetical protein GY838_13585 [bacterium]|nr:hypothetical protein [bacterium]
MKHNILAAVALVVLAATAITVFSGASSFRRISGGYMNTFGIEDSTGWKTTIGFHKSQAGSTRSWVNMQPVRNLLINNGRSSTAYVRVYSTKLPDRPPRDGSSYVTVLIPGFSSWLSEGVEIYAVHTRSPVGPGRRIVFTGWN